MKYQIAMCAQHPTNFEVMASVVVAESADRLELEEQLEGEPPYMWRALEDILATIHPCTLIAPRIISRPPYEGVHHFDTAQDAIAYAFHHAAYQGYQLSVLIGALEKIHDGNGSGMKFRGAASLFPPATDEDLARWGKIVVDALKAIRP